MVLGAAESLETSPFLLIGGRRSVEGWYAGTSIDSEDTLAFSVQSGVRSMNEVYPLERAAEAYDRMMSGKALPGRADDVKPGGLNDDAPHSCHGRRGPGWRRGRPRRGARSGAACPSAPWCADRRERCHRIRLPIRPMFSRNRSSLSQSRPLRSSLMPDEDASIECQRTRARWTRLIAVVPHPRDAKAVATPSRRGSNHGRSSSNCRVLGGSSGPGCFVPVRGGRPARVVGTAGRRVSRGVACRSTRSMWPSSTGSCPPGWCRWSGGPRRPAR